MTTVACWQTRTAKLSIASCRACRVQAVLSGPESSKRQAATTGGIARLPQSKVWHGAAIAQPHEIAVVIDASNHDDVALDEMSLNEAE